MPRALRKDFARDLGRNPFHSRHALLALDAADGSCVGMSTVTVPEDGSVRIWLAPAYRGRGYGRELVAATVEFGHFHLGLKTLTAGTETTNTPCRRALGSGGFTEAQGPALHTLPDGRVIEAVWLRRHEDAVARCVALEP